MGGTLSSIAGYDTQLHYLALAGHAESIRQLTLRGGDWTLLDDPLVAHVDARTADGTTALMICAVFDHVDSARVLTEKGASVNAVDKFGNHALIHAASGGHADMVRHLLEAAGCDIELANAFDANALWSAAFTGQIECVELLLSAQASTAPSTNTKSTPLHAAAYTGRLEVVRLLLHHGMSDSKDANGLTAFILAESKGHQEVADLLRQVERERQEAAVQAAEEAAAEEAHRLKNPTSFLGDMRRPLKGNQWQNHNA